MSQGLLVLNAGSSSIKFSVFALPADGGELELVCRGLQENIGEDNPHFKAFDHAGQVLADLRLTAPEGQYRKLQPEPRRRASAGSFRRLFTVAAIHRRGRAQRG